MCFRRRRNTFPPQKSTDLATYQSAHLEYLSSHSFSLILPENILLKKTTKGGKKRKFLKEYQYFDMEEENGKLHYKVQEQLNDST